MKLFHHRKKKIPLVVIEEAYKVLDGEYSKKIATLIKRITLL